MCNYHWWHLDDNFDDTFDVAVHVYELHEIYYVYHRYL